MPWTLFLSQSITGLYPPTAINRKKEKTNKDAQASYEMWCDASHVKCQRLLNKILAKDTQADHFFSNSKISFNSMNW